MSLPALHTGTECCITIFLMANLLSEQQCQLHLQDFKRNYVASNLYFLILFDKFTVHSLLFIIQPTNAQIILNTISI